MLSQVFALGTAPSSRKIEDLLPVTMSVMPSRLKSPATICRGPIATGYSTGAPKVPLPLPSNTNTKPLPKSKPSSARPADTSRSGRPSPLTSREVTSVTC